MTTGSIVTSFIAALTFLSLVLPSVQFDDVLARRIVKVALTVFVFLIACNIIELYSAEEPYTPSYNPIVYVTDTGSDYHLADCGALWNSSHKTTLCDAVVAQYSRCLRCNSPIYSEEEIHLIRNTRKSTSTKIGEFINSPEYLIPGGIVSFFILVYFYLSQDIKLPSIRSNYFSEAIQHAFVLFGLFFFPAVLGICMLLYSAGLVLLLISVLFIGCFKPLSSLLQNKKKSGIICETVVPNQCNVTASQKTDAIARRADQPLIGSPPETSCHSAPYNICSKIWHETDLYIKYADNSLTRQQYMYLWAAYFYVVVKAVRDNAFIREIYSYFDEFAIRYVKDPSNRSFVVHDMKNDYREIRPLLNRSGIEPCTESGSDQLWELISSHIYGNSNIPSVAPSRFKSGVLVLTSYSKRLYRNRSTPASDIRCSIDSSDKTESLPET